MIYVHFNLAAIPDELKEQLKAAATALDAISDPDARKKFINDNAEKWAAVREFLSGMSQNKCWYSEARECVSRYHVDHYRPHGRAKQAPRDYAEGYSWLAFDLENYRLAGVLCNTVNKEHTEESVGKGDWFPLVDPAKRATLINRSVLEETPILLDPTDPDDPPKIVFNEDGRPAPAPELPEADQSAIRDALRFLGLDQSLLDEARRRTWRECARRIRKFNMIAKKPKGARTAEESTILRELVAELVQMSKAASEFASVVRSCLSSNRLEKMIVRDELEPLAAAAE